MRIRNTAHHNANFDGIRVITTERHPSKGPGGPLRIIDGKVSETEVESGDSPRGLTCCRPELPARSCYPACPQSATSDGLFTAVKIVFSGLWIRIQTGSTKVTIVQIRGNRCKIEDINKSFRTQLTKNVCRSHYFLIL